MPAAPGVAGARNNKPLVLRLPTGVRKENGAHDKASRCELTTNSNTTFTYSLDSVKRYYIRLYRRHTAHGVGDAMVRRFRSGAGSRVRVQYAPGAHGARPLARGEQRAPTITAHTTARH
jgi:hypothetical protein